MRAQRFRGWVSIAAVLALGSAGARAQAQETPAPTAPPPAAEIVPPKALGATVAYPEGGQGDARVVLELTIGVDGRVVASKVIEGPEPFAAAALSATSGWTFEPALRAGKPVAAKIRFEATFEGEVKTAQPEPPLTPTTQSGTPQKPPHVETVTVRGRQPAPGGISISKAEARQLPGAFGDPFRVVESLPGVTPVVSAAPYFFIRGAPPGNVGYFIDGVRVPLLFHALVGPSVIQPALIGGIDVYRGAYPAKYGRFAGGIVAAETAGPPTGLHGEAGIRTLDANGVMATPLADGRGHVTVAGRYSYAGLILSQVSNVILEYWDYQLKAAYDLGRDDTLGVFAFGAFDYLGDTSNENYAGSQFHRIDLRHDHAFGARSRARTAFTVGYDRSLGTGGLVSDQSFAGRLEFEHRMTERTTFRTGADASSDSYHLRVVNPALSFRDARVLFPERTDFVAGIYFDFEIRPEPWFVVRPGLRADVFHSLSITEIGIDPRVSAEFEVTRKVKLVHTFGIAHQSPNYLPNLPGAQIAGLSGGLQRSLQASAGVEVLLPGDMMGSVTAFDQIFLNLSDPLGFSRSIAANADVADIRMLGHAVGLEFMVRRSLTKKIGGIFSYTLSRSTRKKDSIESLSAFDRTHVGTLALSYDLGKGWRAGARGIFSSGVPTRTLTINGPEFGGERAPPYFRLDVRVEKRFRLGKTGHWAITGEVQNATASHEVVGRSCNALRCTQIGVGPLVLPNVGVEVSF
jgi:hypothetical protein